MQSRWVSERCLIYYFIDIFLMTEWYRELSDLGALRKFKVTEHGLVFISSDGEPSAYVPGYSPSALRVKPTREEKVAKAKYILDRYSTLCRRKCDIGIEVPTSSMEDAWGFIGRDDYWDAVEPNIRMCVETWNHQYRGDAPLDAGPSIDPYGRPSVFWVRGTTVEEALPMLRMLKTELNVTRILVRSERHTDPLELNEPFIRELQYPWALSVLIKERRGL